MKLKNHYLSILILTILPFNAILSQPVLDDLLDYSPGENANYLLLPYEDMSSFERSGENVDWDFSGMEESTDTSVIRALSPESTEYEGDFPDANLAVEFIFNERELLYFFENEPGFLHTHGLIVEESGETFETDYIDPLENFDRPVSYGDNYAQATERNYSGMGTSFDAEGTYEMEASAYGSITLPDGETYQDVVLLTITEEYEYDDQFFSMEDYWRGYYWYKEGEKFPVMQIDSFEFNSSMFNSSEASVMYFAGEGEPEDDPNNIAENKSEDGFEVYFHNNELYIRHTYASAQPAALEVYNLAGSKVAERKGNIPGQSESVFNFDDLNQGIYIYRLKLEGNTDINHKTGRFRVH